MPGPDASVFRGQGWDDHEIDAAVQQARNDRAPMTEVRRGEIAILFLRHKMRSGSIVLKPDIRREMANTAKALGISTDEAMEFVEPYVREIVDEMFAPKKDENDKK